MEYFLIGLSLPNESFWVNLRPDSPDNVIDSELAKTDIGKILLEADVQLKKDTAVYTSPQTSEGRKYWNKLYKKAEELYGYENITIPTLTRPWIIPGEIIISEANDTAYIYKASLKVCLEEDYLKNTTVGTGHDLSVTKNTNNLYELKDPRLKELNKYSTQLIKELIIPKLTQEVNTSKRYAALRQVYYSLILAQWFKQRQGIGKNESVGTGRDLSDNFYNGIINSGNLKGLTSKQAWSKQPYYQQYQASFKNGEYNLQEPVNTPYGKTVRTYMSGGTALTACVPNLGPVSSGLREKIPTKTGEPFVCIGSSAINQEEERVTKDYLIKAKVEGAEGNNIGNIEIVSSGIEGEGIKEGEAQTAESHSTSAITPISHFPKDTTIGLELEFQIKPQLRLDQNQDFTPEQRQAIIDKVRRICPSIGKYIMFHLNLRLPRHSSGQNGWDCENCLKTAGKVIPP